MHIKAYQKSDARRLFEYWKCLGTDTPFFFPVSLERWQACLLGDELNGECLFQWLETLLATVDGRVAGVVQFGQPHLAWETDGRMSYDPHIGVIRHLFFDCEMPNVGEALLNEASRGLARFSRQVAFYHALGMSCHAYHGKLHNSQRHVEQLLSAHIFCIEHENAYYVLDMNRSLPKGVAGLILNRSPAGDSETRFTAGLGSEEVGSAQVRHVDRLTDGYTRDAAYLTWFGVEEPVRRRGVGTELMLKLVEFLLNQGYRFLHTDTANGNMPAKRFYEKLRFMKVGHTRSFIRA
jgi:ribosomal protein S18 acetylase RimI-like enzyme